MNRRAQKPTSERTPGINAAPRRLRIVHVVTVGITARSFLKGHFRYLQSQGHDVTLICCDDYAARECAKEVGIGFQPVMMQRAISPLADLWSLMRMRRALKALRPDVVHAHTPKGGLIGVAAAWAARVPIRIYTIHGFVFDARHGWSRWLLKSAERWSCRLARRVLCVSPSLRVRAIEEGICHEAKVKVLHNGSICGVDLKRFAKTPENMSKASRIREHFGIPADAPVVGFVGRLVRDKGVAELAAAWQRVAEERPDVHLLLVGPWEPHNPPSEDVRRALNEHPRIHQPGWQDDVVPYLATMTMLVLPSHREGFGMSIIEAAAMGVPAIATRISGCVDAIEEGVTGVLVPVGDSAALAETVLALLKSPETRKRLGDAAHARAAAEFRPEDLWRLHEEEYHRLATATGSVEHQDSASIR